MQANELRIGNWVLRKNNNEHQIQARVNITYFNLVFEYPNDYTPIPLTPEILEKCGIKRFGELAKQTQRKFYKIGKLVLELIANNRVAVYIDSESQLILIGFQDYLHQLQNLYFALIGEELPVNL